MKNFSIGLKKNSFFLISFGNNSFPFSRDGIELELSIPKQLFIWPVEIIPWPENRIFE